MDLMYTRSSCSLSVRTLLSLLLPACSHEPCQDFSHLRLLLSTVLAGVGGGSSTVTKAWLSSGQRQSNSHRVDPTRHAGGALHLPPTAPPARMLAELSAELVHSQDLFTPAIT